MPGQRAEGRGPDSLSGGVSRAPIKKSKQAAASIPGLESLEPRILLSADAYVFQYQVDIDTLYSPNVVSFDFPIDPDATNGQLFLTGFGDLEEPDQNVLLDAEGLASLLLFDGPTQPYGPQSESTFFDDATLATLAADGNLHLDFTASGTVVDLAQAQESMHVTLIYAIPTTPLALTPVASPGLIAYEGTGQATLSAVGEAAGYSVFLEAGQTLQLETITTAGLSVDLAIVDPIGRRIFDAVPHTNGSATLYEPYKALLTGDYSFSLASTDGIGDVTFNARLNQAVEHEMIGGPTNDTLVGQNLDPFFVNRGFSADAVVLRGSTTPYDPHTLAGVPIEGSTLSESFEAGALPAGWSSSSTGNGRIQFTNSFGADDGSYAMLMDSIALNARNEAIWTVDLDPVYHVSLSFAYAEWSDEDHPLPATFTGSADGDGVSISDDGVNWHTIFNSPITSAGVWQDVTIDLTDIAVSAGLTLGPGFQIKFQQYDNLSLTSDGRGYDNIVLENSSAVAIPSPLPDVYRFGLAIDEYASIELIDPDGDPVAFTLTDDDNQLVTPGGISSSTGHAALRDFKDIDSSVLYYITVTQALGEYDLIVTRGGTLEAESNDTMPQAQPIDRTGTVVGAIKDPTDVGYFQVPVTAGDALRIRTITPGWFSGRNGLDPVVTLLDPTGAVVASDDNSAPDGSNADLSHTAAATGTYTVLLEGAGGSTGNFDLNVSGYTGDPLHAFFVSDSSFPEGRLVDFQPSFIVLTFNETVSSEPLNPSVFTINGSAATSVGVWSSIPNAYFFTTLVADYVEGNNTYNLAGGAFTNMHGDLSQPFEVTFQIDTTPPNIIESSINHGDIVVDDEVTITLEFSEPMFGFLLGTGAHSIVDNGAVETSVNYDVATQVLTATYTGLSEGVYEFTFKDFAANGQGQSFPRDLAGNVIDGEARLPDAAPSGNGVEDGDFIVSFYVDEQPTDTTPIVINPVGVDGSFTYLGQVFNTADFDGDNDRYTVGLNAGQIVSLEVDFSQGIFINDMQLQLLDPGGQVVASTDASSGYLFPPTLITTSGTYTVLVHTNDVDLGWIPSTQQTYKLKLLINRLSEQEAQGQSTNDDTASAEDLNPALVPLESGILQAVVQGQGEGVATADVYKISLAAADELSLSLAGGTDPQAIQLLGPAGELLANGGGSWKDAAGLISGFIAPSTGNYFVRIAEVSGLYTLVATQGAGFSPEPTSSFTEIDLGSSIATVGAIGTSSSDIDTYTFYANAGDNLALWTTTPGSTLPNPLNTLDTFLELKGPDGFLLIESGSGGNGLNALLSHTATETGEYTVRVLSQNNTRGGYILHTAGRSAGASPFDVVVTTITDGRVLTSEPTQLTVHLSLPVRLDTLDAADLMVNGVPAVAVTATSATSLLFDLPTGLGEGTYDITIAGGALLSLAGTAIQPYAQQNFIDSIAPRVISSSMQDGDTLVPGGVILTIVFDEELKTSSLNEFDVDLFGGGSNGQDILFDVFEYDPATSTLTLGFQVEQEGDYGLTLFSNTSAFRDLAGNRLDGETPVWPIPTNVSGNGVAGGNFNLNFKVDNVAPVPIFTPTQIAPLGSLAMQSLNNIGFITDEFDTDTFTVNLQTGQSMTVVLTTQYGGLNPTLTGPAGLIAEPAPGEPIVLRYTHAGPDDIIELVVDADNMTEYDLDIYLNTELESQLAQVTDPAGTAHDLTSLFIGGYAPGIDVANILGTGQPITTITRLNRLHSQLNTTFNFVNMTTPTGDGTLTITAKGDLNDPDEFITISGESVFSADVFQADGGENTFVTTELTIPQADLQSMAANGTISFTVTPSAMVGNFGSSEVTLSLAYPGMPAPPVDAYAIDLGENQTVSVIVNDIDQGTGLFTVELVDAVTGSIVAAGVTDGGFDGMIQALTAPAAGRYHIRVHTPGTEDYSLTVLRGAAFDIELNDAPGNTLTSLDGSDAVQGYLRNLGGERLFATGIFERNNQVFELDPSTLEVINSFFVGSPDDFTISVTGLTFDGDNLYVSTNSLLGLIAVDPDTGTIRWTSPMADGGLVSVRGAVTYHGQGVNLDFNSLTGNLELAFFDIPTGEVIRRVATEPLNVDGTPIAGAATRGSIFVGEFGQISEVDAETGQILNSFPASTSFFGSMAFVAGRLYVSDARFRTTVVYDPDTGQVIQSLQFSQFQPQFSIETIGGDGVMPIQDVDLYTLTLQAGERVTLSTNTPFDDGLGVPLNSLNPAVRVFDPNGVGVAFNDNGSGDGKNALLTFTATAGGVYTVEVTAPSGTGEYLLEIDRAALLLGDVTGDGFVGIEDLNLVLGNWNQTVAIGDLAQGDASGDGFIGIEDLNAVLGNWNATLAPPVVVGDVTGDGFVGIEDLNLVLSNWNTDGSADTRSDPTGDGFVGIEDLNLVLGNWNVGTPPTSGEVAVALQQSASGEPVEVSAAVVQVRSDTRSANIPTASTVTFTADGLRGPTQARRSAPQPESALDQVASDRRSSSSLSHSTQAALAAWDPRQSQADRSGLEQSYTPWSLRSDTPTSPLGLWDDTEQFR